MLKYVENNISENYLCNSVKVSFFFEESYQGGYTAFLKQKN